ncbi:Oidioi.mRNA.OKI2018_I69.chr1.g2584.t1.cds [Oikopleura dioica]|uniref:Oidioi.mRNA.OKI2018_I69.chr1.g2584.t1.cds n=1 Tax=Oikopleura dioica TaxID=34765 RepID=A0ABN7SVS4_OIKDI|nr:Oidioi.mRNA.OKI2018_I69.chr1.g2584.t1.cds [Oikopleura dioica]
MRNFMEKQDRRVVLNYQNDKQSIRMEAENKEDLVEEERVKMLKLNEILEEDFRRLQEAKGLDFEAQEMTEEEKDILWRKNNQLMKVSKKDFTERELDIIQQRIKKVSFDELEEVTTQKKLEAEIKKVKASTSLLKEKYDVLPQIIEKSDSDADDDALEKAKYDIIAKNAIIAAKNEVKMDQLMQEQKLNQQEEMMTMKELQILESKVEMETKIIESLKIKLEEYDLKRISMQKTKEDLELTLDDAIGMSDPSFIALSLSAKDGILEG